MNQLKQKRIKRVFSSFSQITHLWAHQTQDDARTRNGFFEGRDIYSYGRHYLAARLFTVNGKTVAVINSYKYSVTTAKHLRDIERAVEHLPTFHGEDVTDLKAAVKETQESLIDELMKQFGTRKYYRGYFKDDSDFGYELAYGDEDTWCIIKRIEKFNEGVKAIGMPEYSLDVDDEFISLMNSHAALMIKREEELNTPEALAKREQAREKRQAKKFEKAKLNAENWVKGGALMADVRDLETQLIRINADVVETTRGASVPLAHAKRLMMRVINGAVKVGDRVGHFTVDRIDGDKLKIGCHTISIEQAKRILMPETQTEVVA